jgi:hypothetical protein
MYIYADDCGTVTPKKGGSFEYTYLYTSDIWYILIVVAPAPHLVCVMEEARNRGGVQHVGHMLVKQLLAAGVAGVELHGVVAQLLHNMFANSWNVSSIHKDCTNKRALLQFLRTGTYFYNDIDTLTFLL